MKRITLLLLLQLVFVCSCQKKEISSCAYQENSLKDLVDFYCGTVIDLDKLNQNSAYQQIATHQFNSVTAENIMKPDWLHPSRNVYNWSAADQLAAYCLTNNKRLHGHTLIWHQQIPYWLEQFNGSKADWEHLFKDHITQIVQHFKGKVSSWDVVNEAFNDDGTLRTTIWKTNIGNDYIEKAFHYAHEADPEAKLFYNDYSIAINPTKRAAILQYLNRLKAKGVPIHGIGMQMHIFTGFPTNSSISQAINDLWQNDYLVHISELDISMNPLAQDMDHAPKRELIRQAEKYLSIFKTYDRIPDRYKFGITIWGVSDQDSWIPYFYNRDDFPLLFDVNYQAKPAYCKLILNL